MKVEIKESNQVKKRPFPKLMILTENTANKGMIVLMENEGVGMVLTNSNCWNIGDYENSWYMNHFSDFEGSITLSND